MVSGTRLRQVCLHRAQKVVPWFPSISVRRRRRSVVLLQAAISSTAKRHGHNIRHTKHTSHRRVSGTVATSTGNVNTWMFLPTTLPRRSTTSNSKCIKWECGSPWWQQTLVDPCGLSVGCYVVTKEVGAGSMYLVTFFTRVMFYAETFLFFYISTDITTLFWRWVSTFCDAWFMTCRRKNIQMFLRKQWQL